MKEDKKRYEFWFGPIRYSGIIISETETHWVVNDPKEGFIELPKASTTKKEIEQ